MKNRSAALRLVYSNTKTADNLSEEKLNHKEVWKTHGNLAIQSLLADDVDSFHKEDTQNPKDDTKFTYEKNLNLQNYQNAFLLEKEIIDQNSYFTILAYRQTFKVLNFLTLEDFNRLDFLEYISTTIAPRRWKKNTVYNHLQRICVFAHYLSNHHLISLWHRMPNRSRQPKLREMPELREVDYLFEKLLERFELADLGRKRTRWRDFLIARILYETGARIGEVCRLKFGSVKLHGDVFFLIISDGKTEAAQRAIKIPEILHRQIHLYCSYFKLRNPECTLFQSKTGRPMATGDWTNFISQFAKDCGVAVPITPHVFRHYFILRFIADGGSALELMTLLGHSDVRMTVHYFNQVRRLLPFVQVSGDIAMLEREMLKKQIYYTKKNKEKYDK